MRAPCAVLAVAVAVSAAPGAEAGVVVGEGVPFSAGELERALAARTPAAARLALDVRAVAPGRLVVVGAGGRWDVDIGAVQGALAARLVALNLIGAADLAEGIDAPPLRARAGEGGGLAVTARAGASRGVGGDDLTSAVAGLELAGGGRWWLGAAAEWQEDLRAAPAGGAVVDGRSWLARGVAGRRRGWLELGVGLLIGRVDVDSGDHARAWQSGVTGLVRGRWPIAARWALVAGVGVDGFRHRIEVRRDGQVVAATPRVALAATVGLRWELGR